MLKHRTYLLGILFIICLCLASCNSADNNVKIGVSMGVGSATRWDNEKIYMEERAKELNAEIEVRINRTDTPKTQYQDCVDMIDSGIDVLILTPRDASKIDAILDYAQEKKVPVINYARIIQGRSIDLFVGYDSNRIGQKMGQYLAEIAYEGDYIVLQGDSNDNNAFLLNEGAMRYISPILNKVSIILNAPVPQWSPEEAKKMVIDAISANDNKIDAILAPNDKIAGSCVEALAELGITDHVVITGMDAELDAAKRIVAGTQDMTIYMDLKELATTAVNEACHIAKGEEINVNAEFENNSGAPIPANLITGQVVIKENLDRILIDSGYFTREQVYGK